MNEVTSDQILVIEASATGACMVWKNRLDVGMFQGLALQIGREVICK